jgi:hypothetical protein
VAAVRRGMDNNRGWKHRKIGETYSTGKMNEIFIFFSHNLEIKVYFAKRSMDGKITFIGNFRGIGYGVDGINWLKIGSIGGLLWNVW